ncbi:hypothetical protein Tco_1499454 [Tanacetum coccineum]
MSALPTVPPLQLLERFSSDLLDHHLCRYILVAAPLPQKEHAAGLLLHHDVIEPLLYVDVGSIVIMPSYGWRRLLGLSAVPYLAALLFYGLVPESPM